MMWRNHFFPLFALEKSKHFRSMAKESFVIGRFVLTSTFCFSLFETLISWLCYHAYFVMLLRRVLHELHAIDEQGAKELNRYTSIINGLERLKYCMEAFSSHFLDNIWNAIKTSRRNRLNLVGHWWLKKPSLDTRDWRNIISFNLTSTEKFVLFELTLIPEWNISAHAVWLEQRRASMAASHVCTGYPFHDIICTNNNPTQIDLYRSLLHDCHKLSAAINWVIKT